MESVLIVTPDKPFYDYLAHGLRNQCHTLYAPDCESGLMALSYQNISALVLDMEIPGGDGLTFLEEAGAALPDFCLVMSYLPGSFACQRAKDLGATYFMVKPCSGKAVLSRLKDMLIYGRENRCCQPDLQGRTAVYLAKLQIPAKLEGYQQLRVGIPLYLQDPGMLLSKELYPVVAEITGAQNGSLVERSTRSAIRTGRKLAPESWAELFPKCAQSAKYCPSNKAFISKIAQLLLLEDMKKHP